MTSQSVLLGAKPPLQAGGVRGNQWPPVCSPCIQHRGRGAQVWQLAKSRAYTPQQWAARGGGGAEGGLYTDDVRRLNMKERLAECAATEKDRLVFGKVTSPTAAFALHFRLLAILYILEQPPEYR